MIEEKDVEVIEAAKIQSIKIRSVLTCQTKTAVCASRPYAANTCS